MSAPFQNTHPVGMAGIQSAETPEVPPGGAPSLARLAYNRLGFGARANDPEFNDEAALSNYIDAQLNVDTLDDTVCDTFVANMRRKDSLGYDIPPLDATIKQLKTYDDDTKNRDGFAPNELLRHLIHVTYARALLSKKQLLEVMVDFWTNHFNVNAGDSPYKYWEDKHVMRNYALGNFRDLLGASAKSPAMLRYLSNYASDGGNPNENYGRELMELHTLGSTNFIPDHPNYGKGNYTEVDVHRVAGILTGWTYVRSANDEFRFNDSPEWPQHDFSPKEIWLGGNPFGSTNAHFVPYGGIEQGEMLLDILAAHPSTAWFISRKLCRRFISDAPDSFCPDAVRAGAEAFIASSGDIKTVLRAILKHADFRRSWGQKIKRPFEFLVSGLRAINANTYPPPFTNPDDPNNPNDWELEARLDGIGQTLFSVPPPTGYPDFMAAWMNSNQIFGRWAMGNLLVVRYFGDFKQDETTKWIAIPQASAALDALIGGAGSTAAQVVDRLTNLFYGRSIDATDRTNLINYIGGASASINSTTFNLRPLVGAMLASPYFQWR